MLRPAGARWGAFIRPRPWWAQPSSWLAMSGGAACSRGGYSALRDAGACLGCIVLLCSVQHACAFASIPHFVPMHL